MESPAKPRHGSNSRGNNRLLIRLRKGGPLERDCVQHGKKKASWPVSRVLYGPAPEGTERGSHSSGTALARSLLQPTRMTRLETGWALARPCHPYSVLLPVGFAVPSMSPCPRWALTPPFHPYSASGAVCFLWHFPWGRPRRTLSGTVFPWSPDFPPPAAFRHLRGAAARPTGRGVISRPKRQAPEKSVIISACACADRSTVRNRKVGFIFWGIEVPFHDERSTKPPDLV